MCDFVLAEVNSIEEGLLNIYIAFEAAEGASNSNRVCNPTCVSHMLFILKSEKDAHYLGTLKMSCLLSMLPCIMLY